jgi:hypothetical protein
MPDVSLLSEQQDILMGDLSRAWEAAKADNMQNPDSLLLAAQCARDALMQGGTWPETIWLENIFMIGANCCASAVLNLGRYEDHKEIMSDLYGEVIRLKWIKGGPSGHFDAGEAEGLSRAVGMWQTYK